MLLIFGFLMLLGVFISGLVLIALIIVLGIVVGRFSPNVGGNNHNDFHTQQMDMHRRAHETAIFMHNNAHNTAVNMHNNMFNM